MISNFTFVKSLSVWAVAASLFFSPFISRAEGSKQLMADPTSRAALSTVDGSFAAWNSSSKPYGRLNIHLANPATEVVYLGFSMGYSTGASNILGEGSPYTPAYLLRIKDPAGNVVFGPMEINPANSIPAGVAGFDQIMAGPQALGNAGGYAGFAFVPASGAVAGDYYIEFSKRDDTTSTGQISFDYWDITVASAAAKQAIDGRVWSLRWGFYSRDIPGMGEYSGRFKGQLFSYTDEGFVEKISFTGGGIRGGAFLIGMNATGPGTSGNLAIDRKSLYKQSKSSYGYKLFINNPDEAVYATGNATLPAFRFTNLLLPCAGSSINLAYELNRPGTVQVVLDFDKNGRYDAGSRDVVLVQNGTTGSNFLVWDRKDGQGVPVSDAEMAAIDVLGQYTLGTHHLSLDDIEVLEDGFTVTQVRPVFKAGPEDKFCWDDSEIAGAPSGLQVPYLSGPQPPVVNLTGLPVRRWDNFADNNTIGFGNKNTINTWWAVFTATTSGRLRQPACATLPVKLLQFSGTSKGCDVQVSWQTAGEKDLARYEIEHSTTGAGFTKLAQVESSNSLAENLYSYTFGGQNGNNLIRLRMVNKDGSFAYSSTIHVTVACTVRPVLTVSPNPAVSTLCLQGAGEGSLLVLTDAAGRQVLQQRAGTTPVTVNMGALPKGLYHLTVLENNTRIFQTPVIKQ